MCGKSEQTLVALGSNVHWVVNYCM